ncbi:hypothetical protein C2S52_006262 [Perilla frutescens var. hirtella]|nr:hypothetical protein C2S52_006262 [Perilla frutescens var. hirtella]
MRLLIFSIACFYMLSFSNGSSYSIPKVRAVSLGGWLVTEGWIKPSLFDGIPNKDFMDGTQVQLKSVKLGKHLSAESGGGIAVSNITASDSATLRLWRIDQSNFNFRVFNKKFVGLNGIRVVAEASTPSKTEIFQIHRNPHDQNRVRIKASNGYFLQVKTKGFVSADYKENGGWGDDNPSVFLLNITGKLEGEYQVTNGYGPLLAPKEHWSTYIVEKDLDFIKKSGLNTVRLPVGWWIAHDPHPPKPFVAGSVEFVDKAFSWAEKYGIKVILDLHAAPGSQNGWEHSGSRDGFQEWGQTYDTIQQTVDVIDFLTARYAKSPSLFGMAVLNEPFAPIVSVQNLTRFYKASYEVVRKHSSTAYFILANRLGPQEPRELFGLAKTMTKAVIDVHFYSLFSEIYTNLTVQQNIDYIYNNRTQHLDYLTVPNGPLIFVGEWTAEMLVNATKREYRRYAKAQQQVYGKTTFGWAFWTLKNVRNRWSLEWLIKHRYIKI